ncbi:MAG: ankyrin repeat domain-containing protein [Candidatus Dependentiae bacterium]|nr:ankyrin repeat domain-containing protein [Candidatus Dependentiae bacterium]
MFKKIVLFISYSSVIVAAHSYPCKYRTGLIKGAQGSALKAFQEYVPTFYIKWWCKGAIRRHDIYKAAEVGCLNFLKKVVDLRANSCQQNHFDFIDSISGKTPLGIAVEKGQHDVIKFLLDHGAKVDIQDIVGRAPLHVIFNKERFSKNDAFILGFLLAAKPRLDIRDNNRRSAFSFYNCFTTPEKMELARNLFPLLNQLKSFEDADILREILELRREGFDQQLDKEDNSLLLLAAHYNALAVMQWLVKNNEYVNHQNSNGETALSISIQNKNYEAIKFLLEAGVYTTKLLKQSVAFNYDQKISEIFDNYFKKRHELYVRINEIYCEYQKLKHNYKSIISSKSVFGVEEAFFNEIGIIGFEKIETISRLEKLLAQGKQLVDEYKKRIEFASSCCICQDAYAITPAVVICPNFHTVCLNCFNNPLLSSCPLCRAELAFDKLKTCQTCFNGTKNTQFLYCSKCKIITVICRDCLTFPCCKGGIPFLNDSWNYLNVIKVNEYIMSYKENIEEELNDKLCKLTQEYSIDLNNLNQKKISDLRRLMELDLVDHVRYIEALNSCFNKQLQELQQKYTFERQNLINIFQEKLDLVVSMK